MQAAVGIALVLRRAHEAEGRRRGSGPAHRHSEGIVENGVGDRLAAVGDASRAAEGVAVVELARASGALGDTGRVDGAGILGRRGLIPEAPNNKALP